jgi:hypothetical protein
MSSQIIQFPYSKKVAFVGVIVLLIVILLLLKTCIQSYYAHDIVSVVIYGVFVLIIIAVLAIMIYSRLIPALKGEIALELDENGAKDYIRKIVIDWKDIEDIHLRPSRTSAMLVFELKFESDFGKQVSVLLRWVEGRDSDIFNTVVAYFDESEGIIREE